MPKVAGAIAFYPGCAALLKQPYTAAAPLLMLLGAAGRLDAAGALANG